MLAEGLFRHLAPRLHQFGQQFVQGVSQQVGQSVPNQWASPVIVERDAEEGDDADRVRRQATPAQLLADACDLLEDTRDSLNDTRDLLEEIRDGISDLKKIAAATGAPPKKRRR